jgi:hypothetical protein
MEKYREYSKQYSGLRNKRLPISIIYLFLFFTFNVCCLLSAVHAAENPFYKMRDETIAYFKPVTGKVTMTDGEKVVVNVGIKDGVKKGMRFNVLKEEAPFRHPVTKEPLGRMEALIGKLEIKDVNADSSSGIIIEGKAQEGDKIRISEIKVNTLFCQSKDADWNLSDSYYRTLKETGRLNLIDTGMETEIPSQIIEEAKRLKADVALLVTSHKTDTGTLLTQRLFWVSDGLQFSEINTNIDIAYTKELKFAEGFLPLQQGGASIQIGVPVSAKLMTTADIDGDGKREIVFSNGKDVSLYTLGPDLQPALGGIKITGKNTDNHVWIDSIDINKDGKDEIILTSMEGGSFIVDDYGITKKGDAIVSYIYGLKGNEFVAIYKGTVFLRKIGNGLIAQAYSRGDGFDGDVFSVIWEGGYKKGNPLKLPKGVNIYDFVYFDDPLKGRIIVAYDEQGFLNAYDDKDFRIWRSKDNSGGFLTRFKKSTPTVMLDKGEWSMKDRLFLRSKDILSVKRIPLLEIIKQLGYKSSQIRRLWWNGFGMEEGVLIDNISGTLYDYALSGDKIIVLSSPPLGIKPKNILQGENPIMTELSVYIDKGN